MPSDFSAEVRFKPEQAKEICAVPDSEWSFLHARLGGSFGMFF
jgi:hypothetical protein